MGFPGITTEDIERHLILSKILKGNLALDFVPYTGAIKDVDLGANQLTVGNSYIAEIGGLTFGANTYTGIFRSNSDTIGVLLAGDTYPLITLDGFSWIDNTGQANFATSVSTLNALVGTMNIQGGRIIDGSGTISFGNEILTTTGTISNLADDSKHTWGTDGATDSYIQFGGVNLEYYSSGIHDFLSGSIYTLGSGTFEAGMTDGTTIIQSGNYTEVGNITGTDVDISAGTGDYTTTGTISNLADDSTHYFGAANDMEISFTGSDGKIQSNAITSTDGLILQQQAVSISSTGVTPTNGYPLKVRMDEDSTRGIYIDGESAPVTTTTTSYAIYAKRNFDYSGSQGNIQIAYFEAENNGTKFLNSAGAADSNVFRFDVDNNATMTNDSADNINFGVDCIQLTIDDDGTWDTSSTGDIDATFTGNKVLGSINPTLNDSGTNAPDNDYIVYGSYDQLICTPITDNNAWDFTAIGHRINLTYSESGGGSTNSIGRCLYITNCTGFDTNYGINIVGSYDYAMFDNSGADWIWDADNQHLKIGETGTDLDISSDGTNGVIDVATALRLGNATTNYTEISSTGDLVFVGSAGLCFAEIYGADTSTTITITTAGKANKVQITAFAVDGVSNNCTPDHTNNHITITKAGMYKCNVSMHILSVGGGVPEVYGYSVYKNNGATEFANLHGQRNMTGAGGDEGSISLSGIIDLAVNDTIEVWIWNNTNTDNVIVDDINLSLVQIGGT